MLFIMTYHHVSFIVCLFVCLWMKVKQEATIRYDTIERVQLKGHLYLLFCAKFQLNCFHWNLSFDTCTITTHTQTHTLTIIHVVIKLEKLHPFIV